MKKSVISLFLTLICVIALATPAYASTADPEESVSIDSNLKPEVIVENVTTSEGNRVRFLGVGTYNLNYIKFEVLVKGEDIGIEFEPFTTMPEGELTTSLVWANPEEQFLEFKWSRTCQDDYKETSLADIYFTNETGKAISAVATIHVVECIANCHVVEGIEDATYSIEFASQVNPDPDPLDKDRVAIQATTDTMAIIQAWSNGGYVIIAVYNEEGRQLYVEIQPLPETRSGGRAEETLNFYYDNDFEGNVILKAMLVDNSFCPLCQSDECHVSVPQTEEFRCGTPELEQETEQSLISVEVH